MEIESWVKESRKTFESLLKKLQSTPVIQTKHEWIEDLPKDLQPLFTDKESSGYATNTRELHRWYETDVIVYEFNGWFLGIRIVTLLHSEASDIEDVFHHLDFKEYKSETITVFTERKL